MRVLMFGWEFPPHIAGGLGTACYGLTRSLAKLGVKVIFVVPKAYGDEDQRYLQIKNASEVEAPYGTLETEEDLWKQLTFIQINSNMVPYLSPEEYENEWSEFQHEKRPGIPQDIWKQRYNFSGKYGANLMEEVARYAMVAAQVAKELEGQFDVIHAHDWLTYYAGIAAKRVSGKPLVVHMHATEFDRSGENINTIVYNIERTGMMAADRVMAVSNLTRNIVIEKYGIPADKVVTVHNGVRFKTHEGPEEKRGVEDKIVTFLGRITYQKGPDYFVEAAAKVLKRLPNVRFVMAGSGDMLNHVVRRVAKLGISPLEAMKSNVPVIISKQSGVAEVLTHAIKVDYWDVDAMADAIYSLVSYPALHNMFITKGQEEVTTLKWDNAARNVLDVYNAVTHK